MNTLRTLALLAVPAAALVQPPAKPAAKAAPTAAKAAPLAPVTLDSTLLRGYRWRNIGPDRGGRSIAVSGVKGQKNVAYFGAVGGGLWKTTDGGENWFPVTDGQITSASVGAIAVSESNPDVIYIGMGESGPTAANRDTIKDFDETEGDKIDLSGFRTGSEDWEFDFIGGDAFTGVRQVRTEISGGNTYVTASVDGGVDLWVKLEGVVTLEANDFIL